MKGGIDENYSHAISTACIEAIIRSSHDPATNVAMLRNGDICRALMRIMATMVATSREVETPRGLRLMADEFAKDLRVMVIAARKSMDREGSPFANVVHPSDVN